MLPLEACGQRNSKVCQRVRSFFSWTPRNPKTFIEESRCIYFGCWIWRLGGMAQASTTMPQDERGRTLYGALRCDSRHRRTVRTHAWLRGYLEDELRHSLWQWVSISTVGSAKIYFRHLSAAPCCADVARVLRLDVLYPTYLLLQLVELSSRTRV